MLDVPIETNPLQVQHKATTCCRQASRNTGECVHPIPIIYAASKIFPKIFGKIAQLFLLLRLESQYFGFTTTFTVN